jgi:hypothetical protein
MLPYRSLAIAVMTSALLLPAAPAAAQDVQYETVTRVDLPGALGTAVRIAARLGGGSTSTTETTFIKGGRMRTDADRQSTIIDMESRRMIQLDHRERTYTTMSFDQMVEQARRAAREAGAGAAPRDADPAAAEANVSFRFTVDEAGQRERIEGYAAERFFLTMEVEGEYVQEEDGAMERGGTLVVLTDMWTSRDVPALAAMSRFQDAAAREYADASASIMEGLAAAFAEDPRLRVAFEESVDQMRKMDGMPMKTTATFVVVAPDQAFDRELALGERRGPGVAQQAARGALRGLAARAAAARGQQQEPAAGQEQSQATLMRVTSEVRNIRMQALDAALFEAPSDYRRISYD